jgi:hypothetical protein
MQLALVHLIGQVYIFAIYTASHRAFAALIVCRSFLVDIFPLGGIDGPIIDIYPRLGSLDPSSKGTGKTVEKIRFESHVHPCHHLHMSISLRTGGFVLRSSACNPPTTR